MTHGRALLILLAAILASAFRVHAERSVSLDSLTIAEAEAAFDDGTLTAEQLTRLFLERIRAYDRQGPVLRAMIALNPHAVDTARALDVERKAKGPRSPLHGIPIILKDNYDTADMQTTAGSIVLEGSIPPDDSFVVKKLRAAGAVILGKANMSEFASGGVAFSSLGGQMLNPHDLLRSPLASSGGSAVAVAAAYAMISLGTDTGGSIRNPAAATGVVGLKPTHGLVGRTGIVPLALTYDTAGPIARSVSDVATTLSVLDGVDADDASTMKGVGHFDADYRNYLKPDALVGARLGVARDFMGVDSDVDVAIEAAVRALTKVGAVCVDVRFPRWFLDAKGAFYDAVRYPEFAAQIAAYLAKLGPTFPKTLPEVLERSLQTVEKRADGAGPNPARWNLMKRELSSGNLSDAEYIAARDYGLPLTRAMVDALLSAGRLDAIVYPSLSRRQPLITAPPAVGGGGRDTGVNLASVTGYPDLTVPAGSTGEGLPVGLSFLGKAWSEGRLLGLGYAFEQATAGRRLPVHTPPLADETLSIP